jgi:hypothetical protein
MDVKGKNFTRFLERQQAHNDQHDTRAEARQHAKGKLPPGNELISCLMKIPSKRWMLL